MEEENKIPSPPEEIPIAASEPDAVSTSSETVPADASPPAAAPKRKGSAALGALGAFAGACIGAVPYVLIGAYFGILSGWLCFIIAFCAAKGYDLAGGKPGGLRLLVAGVLSTAAVFVATYCMYVLSVMRELSQLGWEVPGFFALLAPLWEMLMEPEAELLGPAVKDLCFGIIFNFLGLYFFSDRRKKADARPAV